MFPEWFDQSVFAGRTLEMICFNANQVYFHFDNHIFICAEAPFSFQSTMGAVEFGVPPTQSDQLLLLIERQISAASIAEQKILTIKFENGAELRFAPTHGYEAYRVTIGDKTAII